MCLTDVRRLDRLDTRSALKRTLRHKKLFPGKQQRYGTIPRSDQFGAVCRNTNGGPTTTGSTVGAEVRADDYQCSPIILRHSIT
jgi:hypothetical protein